MTAVLWPAGRVQRRGDGAILALWCPRSKSVRAGAASAILGLALVMMLVSASLASVGPRSGTFHGNAGAFLVGFEVSPDGKKITGL